MIILKTKTKSQNQGRLHKSLKARETPKPKAYLSLLWSSIKCGMGGAGNEQLENKNKGARNMGRVISV